jgi:protein-glucosylgalactosylhydroxylysine glucosidase
LKFDRGEFSGAFSSDFCSVQYSYFALKNLPFAFYTSVELLAHKDSQISLKLKHEAPDYLNSIQKHFESIDSKVRFDIMHTKATSKTGNLDLVIASSYMVPE